MEKVVVYKSSTGFTKTYAQWIADKLNCPVIDIKTAEKSTITEGKTVIYGGWIMGNSIVGLDKIRERKPHNFVVYGVGSMPKTEAVVEQIREINKLESIPFFYMEGGFRFEKLSFPIKMMLKAMRKSIAKKGNKTETDLFMERNLGTSFDNSNIKNIEPLVEYVMAIK
ncbi:flavodoxin domain-containing protein [Kineothrix sp. MB12-C1]|uniref:flavodoxin domain-containing protein n=1 Tax=Kineothrix sp. MB12-C1 TaxID=3070215 RepID=UPI0027D274C9|nr:flavodoxin domain-containing protein [Kineothrix sp. MB12-C1]WMC93425.1 flavodoxin domain-containing protein [Kineothrix sp. MB12-C1]